MKKDIKYRLWNGAQMESVGSITFHTDGSYHVNDDYPVADKVMDEQFGGNRYYLMSSTGLKDKKGVEIYEGDLVRGPFCAVSSVVFRNGTYCLVHDHKFNDEVVGEYEQVIGFLDAQRSPIEVIGNITRTQSF